MNTEQRRIEENNSRAQRWHLWGPYLSERQWGTVREDYSTNGDAWNYFSHEQARSRAYRWGEDGLGGFAMSGRKRRVLLEEPAAGNLHGGVCEGGDIPVVPWWTYTGTKLETADTAKENL